MFELLATLLIIIASAGAMSVGLVLKGRAIKGSCSTMHDMGIVDCYGCLHKHRCKRNTPLPKSNKNAPGPIRFMYHSLIDKSIKENSL